MKITGEVMRFISRYTVLCTITTLVLSVAVNAAEPPAEPILRINPGEHTARIRSIASDVQGRWLATASDDKTVRVWSLTDGQLLSTLRPPIGLGDEGKLNAVALSPNGAIVAVAGWTQFNQGESWVAQDGVYIYLFERATGRLLHSISGLPNSILNLAFSPDGRWLAATLNGNGGVHVFNAASGRVLAEDRDYGAGSYSTHFSDVQVKGESRLVTTSYDGLMRLYRFDGRRLTLLAKHAAPGGKKPSSARFSPDGTHIAVGFEDTHVVNVLDGNDLSFSYAPDMSVAQGAWPHDLTPDQIAKFQNAGKGNFNVVAWSHDGTVLFAAGSSWSARPSDGVILSALETTFKAAFPNPHVIRRWMNKGKGTSADWPVSGSVISDLAVLPDGKIAFSSIEPAWGVVNSAGIRQIYHGPAVADLMASDESLKLSRDGVRIRFSYAKFDESPMAFDTLTREFISPDTPLLTLPLISAPGFIVTDRESAHPKINGKPIPLLPNDVLSSLALYPNDDGIVLGSRFSLNSYGAHLWQQKIPGIVWGVNVSQDGRWVVAAYGDGTIRWHRASDGVEQLAFFPHADKKRWVMWTPSGYYDASPGAEELIGWHVNNGKDQPTDFFPASRFRDRFNRPDVLSQVLRTQDEAEAVRFANEESGRRTQTITSIAQVLPPVVEIISPASDTSVQSGTIKIRYTVRTAADAPVTAMRVRVNALLQTDSRNLQVAAAGDIREITVNLPEQDAEIQLFAENKYSVSTPAILRLKWAGKVTGHQDKQTRPTKPKLYVLAVGVSKYKNPDYNLGLAAKDAQDFASTMQSQKGKLYGDVVVRLLTDGKATKDDVLEGLDWLKQQVTSRDVGIMFVAGHGMNDKLGNYYFLPHNANPEQLMRTGVSQNDIKLTFASLPGKTVFFVDTCYSGSVLGSVRTSGFINDLASAENGAVVFAASSAGQSSQENAIWGNGAFTKSVVEGLNGKADFRKNGLITAKGLDYYVDDRVKELTKGQQSPVSIAPGGITDFAIAVIGK